MTKETTKMSASAYKAIQEEIKRLTEEVTALRLQRGADFENGLDDMFFSPANIKYIDNDIKLKVARINYLKSIKFEIVEEHNQTGVVDFNHLYRLHLEHANGSESEKIVKLIAGMPNVNSKILECSLNSPIGKAIANKKIGESTTFNSPLGICKVTIVEEVTEENAEM